MSADASRNLKPGVGGRAVHLLLGDNYHEAKLTNVQVEKVLGVAINRNVSVIRALAEKWC